MPPNILGLHMYLLVMVVGRSLRQRRIDNAVIPPYTGQCRSNSHRTNAVACCLVLSYFLFIF